MGRIREERNKREQIVSSIRVLLENQGIDSGADWDKDPENLRRLNPIVDGSTNYVISSTSLGITQEDDQSKLIFAVCQSNPAHLQSLLQGEAVKALKEQETTNIQLVFFVKDMRHRIALEILYDKAALAEMKRTMKKVAGANDPSMRKKSFTLFSNFILLQEYEEQDVRLTELNGLDMFHEPPLNRRFNLNIPIEEPWGIQARVFTIDLYQLVQKYNLIGDMLFQNNVRFGIKEAMGVDQSIRQTLRDEPQYFWFKNNGVTILIRDSRTSLQEAKSILLGKLDPNQLPNFSIINGAQTITTAAQYFFELEYNKQTASPEKSVLYEAEFERAKKYARVLVRVVHISSIQDEKLSKAISVALNRQKPIRIDDIAFTNPAVLKLTECLHRMPEPPFMLVRQGEATDTSRRIEIASFARSRMACIGLPGAARSYGRNKLLDTKTDEDGNAVFTCQGLFAGDWLSAEDETVENAILNRDYRAIWFAHQTAALYEAEMRRAEYADQDISNVIKNGKWYFTAIITQILNKFSVFPTSNNRYLPDFSEFFEIELTRLPQLMESFAKLAVAVARKAAEGKEINSNLFKQEELYNHMMIAIKEYFASAASSSNAQTLEFYDLVKALVSQIGMPQMALEADLTDFSSNYVVLNGVRTDVKTDADALVAIAEYIMIHYADKEKVLLDKCRGWLYPVNDASATASKTFQAGENFYFVETHVNTPGKRIRMKNLCKAAEVPADEIKWHKPGDKNFTFSS